MDENTLQGEMHETFVTPGVADLRDSAGCDWIVYHRTQPTFMEADGGFINMDDFTEICEVRFVKNADADTDAQMDCLFRITNSVDEAWNIEFVKPEYHDRFVMTLVPDVQYRSTSVGDLFFNGNSRKTYEVAGCGFNEVEASE